MKKTLVEPPIDYFSLAIKTMVRVIEFGLLALIFLFLPPQNHYSFRAFTEEKVFATDFVAPTPAPYPLNQYDVTAPLLTAQGTYVSDIASGATLYEKNPDERLFPASTTKIMTALVALDEYDLDEIVTVKSSPPEGQKMNLFVGETISVENLLYGILVHSANDGALALADHDPGGVSGFVEKMNQKAVELGLTSTHFENPIGLDDLNQYTTVKELAKLSMVAIKNPLIVKIVSVPQITVSDSTYSYFHSLKNVNELLGKVPGVSGFKTGQTELAGQALVTTVQRGEHKILIVILKSADRFGETEQVINWVFGNFVWKEASELPIYSP